MKRVLFIPMMLSAVPAIALTDAPVAPLTTRAAVTTPMLLVQRDSRGLLRTAPCARINLSDPAAFLSDDTVRSKRCEKPSLGSKPVAAGSLKGK